MTQVFIELRPVPTLAAVLIALSLSACQPSRPPVEDTTRDAVRSALRAAWHAYIVQSPGERASTEAGVARAAEPASVSHFEAEDRSALDALDTALVAIPIAGSADRRYLRQTLTGLISTLHDRHDARMALLEATQDQSRGVYVDEETGMRMLRTTSVTDGVAERTILRLAAWERRFLHESYLADSYEGRLLAQVENTRANGTPDSMLLHRPEIEGRIVWADSAVVAEIGNMR